MKTKLILICLLFSLNNIQAQETDSLWNAFKKTLNEIVLQERGKAYKLDYFNDSYSSNKLINILINSPVEEQGLEYIFQNFRRDSLPNVRDFVCDFFYYIARYSDNESARKKAIEYNFALSPEPDLSGLKLEDFNDILKQELMKQYTRQFTEEELSFFAESYVKYWMRYDKKVYDYIITDTIKKYQDTISYEEAKEIVFNSKISEYKQKIQNTTPSPEVMIISGQLNMQETIPYLEGYANDSTYSKRRYAAYALAVMCVDDYEDKIVSDFDIDIASDDMRFAEIINSQKVWYAYMRRLKSQKYSGKCPVSYLTTRSLGYILKDFPTTDRPLIESYIEFDDGVKLPILSEIEPVRIVPDGCGLSTQKEKTPINPDHIKVVVDWMEANKGKYELRQKIDRTF